MVDRLRGVIEENPVVLLAPREIDRLLDYLQKNNVTALPCKRGDKAWVIRNHRGKKYPHQGVVSEMYFTADMQLAIVVRGCGRGVWGQKVFPTMEDAAQALRKESEK